MKWSRASDRTIVIVKERSSHWFHPIKAAIRAVQLMAKSRNQSSRRVDLLSGLGDVLDMFLTDEPKGFACRRGFYAHRMDNLAVVFGGKSILDLTQDFDNVEERGLRNSEHKCGILRHRIILACIRVFRGMFPHKTGSLRPQRIAVTALVSPATEELSK